MTTTPSSDYEIPSGNTLDAARAAFGWLTAGPHPVTVDGRLFEYLPDRDIPVDELRDLLLHRQCPRAVWDQVWAHVLGKVRQQGGTWTLVAVGLALPMLTSMAARLTAHVAGDPHDIHAEVLRGFLEALATVEVDRPRIVVRLRWAAYRAGHRALATALQAPNPTAATSQPVAPTPLRGHPDLVLARSLAAGVLSSTEAQLIGDTRLEDVSLTEWAAVHNLTYAQVQRARHRAEQRLASWLAATESEHEALSAQRSEHGLQDNQ